MEITRVRDHNHVNKVDVDLLSPGYMAKMPMIGLVMFLLGSLIFGALTYNLLAQGPLLAWDKALATVLPAIALKSPPIVKIIMETGYYLGAIIATVLSILLGIYFLRRRHWQEFVMVAVGMAGSALLWYSLSNFFGRERPPTQIWNVLKIPGFPSGHTMTAVVFYGLLAYLIAPKMPSAFWKAFVVVAAIVIMVWIGFSRVFTGGHYLTDVLAGYAVGIAWFGAAFTLIEMYFQRRKLHAFHGARK